MKMRVDKKLLVETAMNEQINKYGGHGSRGSWQIHIFPDRYTEGEIIHGVPEFVQEGNYYGDGVGHVCMFDVIDFFEAEYINYDELNECRSDAKKQFMHDIEEDSDHEVGDLTPEQKIKLDAMQDEWQENVRQSIYEELYSSVVNMINCEDVEGKPLHSYEIEYVE